MSQAATTVWPAPAKLNLMLRVVGRRADGYHELQTVFQFLDHGDRIHIRSVPDGQVRRLNDLPGVAEEQDLVVRAARLLQQATGTAAGAAIRVEKRLPMGGGLGGGSSDAATVLAALNKVWRTGLDAAALGELGLCLGADVPVFLYGRAAWAEGVGERLTAVELPQPWYLVLKPPCEVATGEIFQDPELTRNSPRITIRDFLQGGVGNDCEAVVAARYPEVREALAWLGRYARAHLTGTGACVFAAFPTREQARGVLDRAPPGYRGFVARGLNRSPLLRLLEDDERKAGQGPPSFA